MGETLEVEARVTRRAGAETSEQEDDVGEEVEVGGALPWLCVGCALQQAFDIECQLRLATAVVQGIAIRVKMVLGEYWLDEEVGVDWIGSILGKGRDPLVVRSLIKDAIASTPDVTEVVDVGFTLDAATRSATVSYVVLTVYSTQPIAGTVVFP